MSTGSGSGPVRWWRRPVRWLAAAVALVVVGALGFWAGQQTWGSPVAEPEHVGDVIYEVAEATVGRSLSLNVTVDQPLVPVAANGLAGTVTSVGTTDQVDVGDVLYAVDTMPVRAVVGQTPFWRDLRSGLDGADVVQLQEALTQLDFYAGPVDGRFRWSTELAVRAWQDSLDIAVDGQVRLGEVVAVPELPARLRLAEEVITGGRLAGGEQVVFASSGEIDFHLTVSPEQARMIPAETVVRVAHEDHVWEATIGESGSDDGGNMRFDLHGPEGGLVCGEECDALPAQERMSLRADVTVAPEVSGPAVPVAAVRTDPDGSAWVRLADGTRQQVTVLGSAGGVAVVDGLSAGDLVRVVGGDNDGGGPDSAPAGGHGAGG